MHLLIANLVWRKSQMWGLELLSLKSKKGQRLHNTSNGTKLTMEGWILMSFLLRNLTFYHFTSPSLQIMVIKIMTWTWVSLDFTSVLTLRHQNGRPSRACEIILPFLPVFSRQFQNYPGHLAMFILFYVEIFKAQIDMSVFRSQIFNI